MASINFKIVEARMLVGLDLHQGGNQSAKH